MKFGRSQVMMLRGKSDEEKLRALGELAGKTRKGTFRRKVCFQVASQQMLRQLQTQECSPEIAGKLEVYPFSFEELWAQRMFVSLPHRRTVSSPLDWKPMTWDCGRRVHLMIFGMNSMSEALVRQACLVCHYPNFIRDNTLRTCITIVDPTLKEDDNLLVRRYRNLMSNCRWRFVDKHGCASEHTPECDYLGGEYTDIEFQLIAAEAGSVVPRVLLTDLAKSERDLPTIVFAGEDGEANWDFATGLPTEYYVEGCEIPVYARMKSQSMLGSATMMPQYRNIRAFGMDDCEYDLSLPLAQMAMGVCYLYDHCAETGEVTCDEVDRRRAMRLWNETKSLNRFSSEANAMTIMTKLRSVGKEMGEELTDREAEILSEVEHNRWSVERLMSGVRPVTREEQAEIDKDRSLKKKMRERGAHYDLRPYEALRDDFAGRNVQLYDEVLVRGLAAILKAFQKGDTGAELVVVKREEEEKHGRAKKVLKWVAAVLLALVVTAVVGYIWVKVDLNSAGKMVAAAEEQVGQYVYLLHIDSIEVWYGNNGIDTVLRSSRDQDVGTAFSLEGVGIVTARHCVEYWLYDCMSVLDSPEVWTPEMRLASEVETFNSTTTGEKKRMVAICSILDQDGGVVTDRLVFDVDQSRDRVCGVGPDGAMWRYVVPVFKRDKDMLKSDIAVVRRDGEKGIKLCGDVSDLSGDVCALGFPQLDREDGVVENKRLRSHNEMQVREVTSVSVKMSSSVSPGMSGGPVLKPCLFSVDALLNHHLWGYEVVGVMSRNGKTDGNSSFATLINI